MDNEVVFTLLKYGFYIQMFIGALSIVSIVILVINYLGKHK